VSEVTWFRFASDGLSGGLARICIHARSALTTRWTLRSCFSGSGQARPGSRRAGRRGERPAECLRRRQPCGRWWKPPGSTTTPEVADWGRPGPNQMITLNALRALKAAGRLTLPAIRT